MPALAVLIIIVLIVAFPIYVWVAIQNLRRDVDRLQRSILRLTAGDSAPHDAPSIAPLPVVREPSPAPAPASPALSAPRPRPQPAPPHAWRPAGVSLESFVGGRVMLIAGVVVVLCGLAFFLKFAFDRDWIKPPMRIALGMTLGVVALGVGDRLRFHGLRAFGHAIMGGGLGALYLSNFFAVVTYGFFEQPLAFAIAAAITALGAVIAIRRDAPLLAHLGFFGGFLAPAMLGRHVDALGSLASWLIVLDLGLLVVLWRRPWRGFDVSALASSILYFAHWRMTYFAPGRESVAALCIAGLVVAMLLTCLVPSIAARRRVPTTALGAAGFAGLAGFLAAYDVMFAEHRGLLGVGLVALSIAYFAAARVLGQRVPADVGAHDTLDAFGLAAFAAAVPVVFRGYAIAPAWALAGVATVALWRWRRLPYFDRGGAAMVVLALGNLVTRHLPLHTEAYVPFANGAFLSFAIPCAALVVCGRMLRREPDRAAVGGTLIVIGLWLFVPLLASEMWQHFTLNVERYGLRSTEYAKASAAMIVAAYAALLAWTVRRVAGGDEQAPSIVVGPLLCMIALGLVVGSSGHRVAFTPGLNAVFLSGIAVILTAFAIRPWVSGSVERLALYGGLVSGLVLLAGEFHAYGELAPLADGTRDDLRFFAQLWISIAWGLYAAALIVVGFRRGAADLRWAGLVVFGITLLKVFLVDMAGLSAAYRIGSFMILGMLLVAASYLYQRSRATT